MSNPYEALARTHKVTRLVQALREVGATPDIAATFSIGQRLLTASAAHVNPPSDETWQQVVDQLTA